MSAAAPVTDAILLPIGRDILASGKRPGEIAPIWMRARIAFRTQQEATSDVFPDEDCRELMHRAAALAEDERDEAGVVGSVSPDLPRGPRPLPGYTSAAIWEGVVLVPYLVKLMLIRGGLTVIFGMSGHLKSVVAMSLAFSVGTGRDFFGFRTRERGGVVYIVGEGFAGIRKRARAWLIEHGFDATSEQPAVYFTSAGADLFSDAAQVRATIEHAASVLGVPIAAVIVDTLTANAGSADLNDARDMNVVIAAVQQSAPDAAVVLVHHVGHGDPDRERNSSALIAAADIRVQAAYDEVGKVLELRWRKVKDDDAPAPVMFRPKVIPLDWEDEDGIEQSSIVLEQLDEAPRTSTAPRAPGLGKNQELALKSLRTLFAKVRKNLTERGDDPANALILIEGWRADLERRGIDRKRFREVWTQLQERGFVAIDGPHVRLVEGAA